MHDPQNILEGRRIGPRLHANGDYELHARIMLINQLTQKYDE
jgi:hypothetical protein